MCADQPAVRQPYSHIGSQRVSLKSLIKILAIANDNEIFCETIFMMFNFFTRNCVYYRVFFIHNSANYNSIP